jgi:hypothetical protein
MVAEFRPRVRSRGRNVFPDGVFMMQGGEPKGRTRF